MSIFFSLTWILHEFNHVKYLQLQSWPCFSSFIDTTEQARGRRQPRASHSSLRFCDFPKFAYDNYSSANWMGQLSIEYRKDASTRSVKRHLEQSWCWPLAKVCWLKDLLCKRIFCLYLQCNTTCTRSLYVVHEHINQDGNLLRKCTYKYHYFRSMLIND